MNNLCYILHHKDGISEERDGLANEIELAMKTHNIPKIKTKTIYPNDYKDLLYKMPLKIINSMPVGAIGLYLSNYFAWKKFIYSDYEYAIILEDDAVIENSFFDIVPNIIDYIKSKKDNFIISLFSHPSHNINYSKKNHSIDSNLLCKNYAFYASPAYLIDRSAAKSLIKNSDIEGIQFPIDLYLFNYSTKISNVFAISPDCLDKPISVKFLDNFGKPVTENSTIQGTDWIDTGKSYSYIEGIIPYVGELQ